MSDHTSSCDQGPNHPGPCHPTVDEGDQCSLCGKPTPDPTKYNVCDECYGPRKPVPSGNQPRWTVDEDGWLISPSTKHAIASWDMDEIGNADTHLRPEDFDALVALVRSAAEVPALRERVAQVEAERTEWFATVDRLAEERDQLLDTSNHRGAVISLQRQRDQLTERLAAAEAVIRRIRVAYYAADWDALERALGDEPVGADARPEDSVTVSEAIARARGETNG